MHQAIYKLIESELTQEKNIDENRHGCPLNNPRDWKDEKLTNAAVSKLQA
jgi:uncharacterized protein (DUF1786 family)